MMSFDLHDRQLARLYARSPAKVAFVDEAYRTDRQSPFYVASAVVLDLHALESVRDDLLTIVDGDFWHTADAFRKGADPTLLECLQRIVARLAQDDAVTLCTVDTDASHFSNVEAVRAFTLVSLATLLVRQHEVELMVYERRREGAEEAADFRTEAKLQTLEATRDLRMHGGTPSSEPLLWAADVLASTLRRRIALKDGCWFEPLRAKTAVYRSGNFERIDLPT